MINLYLLSMILFLSLASRQAGSECYADDLDLSPNEMFYFHFNLILPWITSAVFTGITMHSNLSHLKTLILHLNVYLDLNQFKITLKNQSFIYVSFSCGHSAFVQRSQFSFYDCEDFLLKSISRVNLKEKPHYVGLLINWKHIHVCLCVQL